MSPSWPEADARRHVAVDRPDLQDASPGHRSCPGGTGASARRTVIVRGMAERRVSAVQAAELFEETADSVAERERQAELRRLAGPVDFGRRPTKRDRRRFDAGPR
jgi:hypothetical protein